MDVPAGVLDGPGPLVSSRSSASSPSPRSWSCWRGSTAYWRRAALGRVEEEEEIVVEVVDMVAVDGVSQLVSPSVPLLLKLKRPYGAVDANGERAVAIGSPGMAVDVVTMA